MKDARQIADAFREIYSAAMKINEALGRNDALNDAVPPNWPLPLSADEFAAECQGMAEHYDAVALAQFVATKRRVEVLNAAVEGFDDSNGPALVYADCLAIEICSGENDGKYQLMIANDGWLSADLLELEKMLYDYAVKEQIV